MAAVTDFSRESTTQSLVIGGNHYLLQWDIGWMIKPLARW